MPIYCSQVLTVFELLSNTWEKLSQAWQRSKDRRELARDKAKKVRNMVDKIGRSHNIEIVKSHDDTTKN